MATLQRVRVRRAPKGSPKRVYIRRNEGKYVVRKLVSWYRHGEYLVVRVDAVEFLVEHGRILSVRGDVLGTVTFNGDTCILELSPDWIDQLRAST